MNLANMRRQGVHHLIAYCHNDACRHQALIDVSQYPGDTLVTWFQSKDKCGKCAVAVDGLTSGLIGKRSRECRTTGKHAQLGKSK
jgi:hypothetical protein